VNIVAIELLAAAQGVEFHHPQKSSPTIEKVISLLREVSPTFAEDRSMSADITRVAALIDQGVFCEYSASILPSLNT
jgi:histidine ammonia-lyase